MGKHVRIRKGVDIKLVGNPENTIEKVSSTETAALKPVDFHGLVPKMIVGVGDEVKVGSPIFADKYNPDIRFGSPVSGEVVEIQRGAKRKILAVKILADKDLKYEEFSPLDINSSSREQIIEAILKSGQFCLIKQRPYDVIANPTDIPKAIFVSLYDSTPLGVDFDVIFQNDEKQKYFQTGIQALAKLTSGAVHVNMNAKATNSTLNNVKNAEVNVFKGPHPAGNVGVQIHHVSPMNKGEKVWVVGPQDVAALGKFFTTGKVDSERVIALCGSQVKNPKYYKTHIGNGLKDLLSQQIKEGDSRIISGDVLTGVAINQDDYVSHYINKITVIPERTDPELFGWLVPTVKKFSISRTLPSFLMPNKKYDLNTGLNGEERAFVMSGELEKVFPMDIYPVHLIKAMMADDIEGMENLGIYEVAPEDFALCEFVCTSKIDIQEIVREGLDLVQKECG